MTEDGRGIVKITEDWENQLKAAKEMKKEKNSSWIILSNIIGRRGTPSKIRSGQGRPFIFAICQSLFLLLSSKTTRQLSMSLTRTNALRAGPYPLKYHVGYFRYPHPYEPGREPRPFEPTLFWCYVRVLHNFFLELHFLLRMSCFEVEREGDTFFSSSDEEGEKCRVICSLVDVESTSFWNSLFDML